MDGFERRAIGMRKTLPSILAEQRGDCPMRSLARVLIAHDDEMMQEESI